MTKKIEREVINITNKFVDRPVIEKRIRENHKATRVDIVK